MLAALVLEFVPLVVGGQIILVSTSFVQCELIEIPRVSLQTFFAFHLLLVINVIRVYFICPLFSCSIPPVQFFLRLPNFWCHPLIAQIWM